MTRGITFALRETLFAAVMSGDIPALEAFFSDVRVRADVDETELFIVENNPKTVCFRRGQFGMETPWYCTAWSPNTKLWNQDVFSVAMVSAKSEVVKWFFSQPQLDSIKATMALVWPNVARSAVETKNAELLEFLLDVGGSDLISEGRREAVFASILCDGITPSVDMMKIVVAHGGGLQFDTKLVPGDALETIINDGALAVGADVLFNASFRGDAKLVQRLIEHGADCGVASDALVIAAVRRHFGTVHLLLTKGFVDIDTQCGFGMTALIGLSGLNPVSLSAQERENQVSATRALLEAGADVTIKDKTSTSALQYVVQRCNPRMVELLLQYGADPNAVDHIRGTVTSWMDVKQIGTNQAVAQTLELLLCYGADPHADSRFGGSVADRLIKYEAGKAFMAARPEYF